MHRHTVLFNLKDELAPAERERVMEAMRSLAKLPTVQDFFVGKNIIPKKETSPFEWLLIGDFANEDDRQAYEKNETHVAIIRGDFLPSVKDYIVLDVNT